MKRIPFAPLAAGLGISLLLSATALAGDLADAGRRLAETNCARCHAIGDTGASPHAEAPPFRALATRYPVDSLAEAFAEGLSVGHDDMPEFTLSVEQSEALLAFLVSIQSN